MKFYSLIDPRLFLQYARFSHVGTWSDGELCQDCGYSSERLIEPLQIEWEPDSEHIGHFSWCGYTAVIVEDIVDELISHQFECGFGRVAVMPPTTRKKGRARVPFPYDGSTIKWLIPTEKVRLNIQESNIPLIVDCPSCGFKKYRFRKTQLIVSKNDWNGQKMFRLSEFSPSAITFVSEEGKALLGKLNIINLLFEEAGEIR